MEEIPHNNQTFQGGMSKVQTNPYSLLTGCWCHNGECANCYGTQRENSLGETKKVPTEEVTDVPTSSWSLQYGRLVRMFQAQKRPQQRQKDKEQCIWETVGGIFQIPKQYQMRICSIWKRGPGIHPGISGTQSCLLLPPSAGGRSWLARSHQRRWAGWGPCRFTV